MKGQNSTQYAEVVSSIDGIFRQFGGITPEVSNATGIPEGSCDTDKITPQRVLQHYNWASRKNKERMAQLFAKAAIGDLGLKKPKPLQGTEPVDESVIGSGTAESVTDGSAFTPDRYELLHRFGAANDKRPLKEVYAKAANVYANAGGTSLSSAEKMAILDGRNCVWNPPGQNK